MHFKPPSMEFCDVVFRKMMNESDEELPSLVVSEIQNNNEWNPDYIGWDILKLDSNHLEVLESCLNSLDSLVSLDSLKNKNECQVNLNQFSYYMAGKRFGFENQDIQSLFQVYAIDLLQKYLSIAIQNNPPLLPSEFKTILLISEWFMNESNSCDALESILMQIHTHFKQQPDSSKFLSFIKSKKPIQFELENCPACKGTISMNSLLDAKCSNDHYWDRCLFSLQILSSPFSRVCMGCGKKAFIQLDGYLNQMNYCLYCHGHFKLA